MKSATKERGFSILAAVFLLVIMVSLSAFLVSISSMQQMGAAVDLQGSRAYQAARAGVEWGAYQMLTPAAAPPCSSTVLTFSGTTLRDFSTTVTCAVSTADELGTTANIYKIIAVACNQPACPSAAPAANYVERQLTITVSR
ncbi:MAG: agglutinin biogenesis protein MshP [Pseudomonadota bacterium]